MFKTGAGMAIPESQRSERSLRPLSPLWTQRRLVASEEGTYLLFYSRCIKRSPMLCSSGASDESLPGRVCLRPWYAPGRLRFRLTEEGKKKKKRRWRVIPLIVHSEFFSREKMISKRRNDREIETALIIQFKCNNVGQHSKTRDELKTSGAGRLER